MVRMQFGLNCSLANKAGHQLLHAHDQTAVWHVDMAINADVTLHTALTELGSCSSSCMP